MEALINEMVPFLKDAWATAGLLGAVGGVLMFAIRIFRLGLVQNRLPAKVRWAAWPTWLKWLSPFVGALAGMMVIKVAGGMAWAPAITAAIAAAIVSIGGNSATKTAGAMLDKAIVYKIPGYKPGRWRELSLPSKIGKDLQAPVLESVPLPPSPPLPPEQSPR